MIKKRIDENTVSIMPEDPDDLLNLRRIIKAGDKITGNTVRTIKQEREYARPDKGQRVKIRILLGVEKVSLDMVLDKLRIGGTILESNNDTVPHGSHHSIILKINDGIVLYKKKWLGIERKLLNSGRNNDSFILLAVDTTGCGLARLVGTHLELLPNMYSGAGGKRYKTNFDAEKFFEQIRRAVAGVASSSDTLILFGPGETKKRLSNFLQKDSYTTQLADGIDSGGEDGIHLFTKSQAMRDIIHDSKLARVSSIIDEIMMLANKQSTKFTMGFEETTRANQTGAIKSLIFSDRAIQENEDHLIDLLNSAESNGAETFAVDSSTDLGLRVTGLGGIVSLLRYAV